MCIFNVKEHKGKMPQPSRGARQGLAFSWYQWNDERYTFYIHTYPFIRKCIYKIYTANMSKIHFFSFNLLRMVASETPNNRAISRLLFPASFKCNNFNSLMVNLGRPFGFPPRHCSSFFSLLKNLFSKLSPSLNAS